MRCRPFYFSHMFAGTEAGGRWGSGSYDDEDIALSANQKMRIQELQNRDAEFDLQLDEIGEGIQDLSEIAAMQGEEVTRQNMMLENVGRRIDSVHEHVTNVNSKMKDTLNEVGRAGDKLCVDITCIVSVKSVVAEVVEPNSIATHVFFVRLFFTFGNILFSAFGGWARSSFL